MVFKFAHFADVHWRGLSRHDEYRRAFEDAFNKLRAEKVDAIFIVGDIVHSKTQGISPELISSLCWWFKSLAEIAPTYVTLGNHDGLIMNKDREDAITPIINALNLPDLHLIKYSESFDFADKFHFSNFSCFDEEGWKNLQISKDKINVALYHGAVKGSLTDIDWELDGEVDVSIFDDYDFVFLGDIHKRQYLDKNKRVAYCGSTIQQNYGETPDKGFLIWEIESLDKYDSRHVKVKHDRPFVTIEWQGDVTATIDAADQYPDYAKYRVRTTVPISQGEIKQLYSSLKEFKSASEIVMKHDSVGREQLPDSFSSDAVVRFDSAESVSNILLKYYEKATLSERLQGKLSDLVSRFWKNAVTEEKSAGSRWHLKELDFDNTFGYGKGNKLDFLNQVS